MKLVRHWFRETIPVWIILMFVAVGIAWPQNIVVPSGGGITSIPATVSGATSGGIPCFDTATDMKSTVALTANTLVKGGGAGACPTNTAITESGGQIITNDALQLNGTGQLSASGGSWFAYNSNGTVPLPFATGPLTSQDTGPVHSNIVSGAVACETSFGATTLSTGAATTNTGQNCLPANAIILGIVYRITTTITTATSFTIGDSSTAARFCSTQSTLTSGTTGTCIVPWTNATAGTMGQASAASVRVTANSTPGAGAIRLIVYAITLTPPTS